MKRHRWKFVALVVALILGIGAGLVWVKAPQWVASYVEERAPGVKIGRVELGYPQVTFHDVKVARSWFKGSLTKVVADQDRNISVYGGHLDIDLDKRPKSTADAQPKEMTLQSVEIDTFTLASSKKLVSLEGDNLTYKDGQVCFKEASAKTTNAKLQKFLYMPKMHLEKGCFKNESLITLNAVMVALDIPKGVPTMEGHYLVHLQGLEVYPLEEYFKAKQIEFRGFKAEAVSIAYKHDTLYVDADTLRVDHSWVAPSERFFSDLKLALDIPGRKGTVSSKSASVSFGLGSNYWVEGDQECNEWVDALPYPNSGAIKEFQGTYTGRLSFQVNTDPTPSFKVKNNCKVDCSNDVFKKLKSRFTYEAYDKQGKIFLRESGPSTKDWVPLYRFPVNIPSAFIRLEDPSFLSHRGILPASLKVALEQNIEKGRFFRGGSTITQQLAKNLWLRRHKTLGRKVEEAFLTIALESCLTKDQILELYFNVIEYGPDLYGIGPATQTYFKKPVEGLTLKEAYFLAALLRNPKAALQPDQGGLARAQNLMALLAKNGLIAEELVPPSDDIDTTGWETE